MPAAAISASGTSAHQLARHPSVTVSRPPSSGPSRFATPADAPQIPSAPPRRSGGNPLTAPASAAGLTRPAPTPCTTRLAISAPMLDMSAPAPAPTAHAASPAGRATQPRSPAPPGGPPRLTRPRAGCGGGGGPGAGGEPYPGLPRNL